MHCKRHRHPLILLYAAVVVRVQISKPAVFVKRILFEVKPASINVRSEYLQAAFDWLRPDLEKGNRFLHAHAINFIARLESLPRLNHVVQVLVANSLRQLNRLDDAFTFGLATAYEVDVARR